jgi:hypothetical protein
MGIARGTWLPAAAALVGACATTTTTTTAPLTTTPAAGDSAMPLARLAAQPPMAPRPAPPAGLQIQAENGSLDREDVEEAVEPHFPKLVRCYDDATGPREFANGQVTLRFVVGLDGTTSNVHVRSSDLGSYEVERCLAAVAAKIRFPRPHGYGVASFEYSLEFHSTGAIPVVELAPTALAADLPYIGNRLAEDCGALGPVELRATLYVDRYGRVRSAGFGTAIPLAPERAACFARSLQRESLTVTVQGGALGRVAIALRSADLLAARRPEPAPSRRPARSTHGRRSPRGR